MFQNSDRLALYMEGRLDSRYGKMGHGLLRYSRQEILCVVDSCHAGKTSDQFVSGARAVPVVASVDEAGAMGANVLVLAITPSGGRIEPHWQDALDEAVAAGMSLVNGMHQPLGSKYPALREGQWIWDIRVEPEGLPIASAQARDLPARRVLLVGTDMATGKMTAGLELHQCALERGLRSAFVATGQVGIAICGGGVPLDAIRLDYAAGAIEKEVLAAGDAEIIFLEGQGSILHPGSSATLPLIRGLCPTHMILCHRPMNETHRQFDWLRFPPLGNVVRLYEDLAEACGIYQRPKTTGIALDTSTMSPDAAADACRTIEAETHLPSCDVIRDGPERLLDALLD